MLQKWILQGGGKWTRVNEAGGCSALRPRPTRGFNEGQVCGFVMETPQGSSAVREDVPAKVVPAARTVAGRGLESRSRQCTGLAAVNNRMQNQKCVPSSRWGLTIHLTSTARRREGAMVESSTGRPKRPEQNALLSWSATGRARGLPLSASA